MFKQIVKKIKRKLKDRPLKYVYYVTYKFFGEDNSGEGCITLYRVAPINSEAEVDRSSEFIKKQNDLENVMITNFILLTKRGKI